MADVKEQANAGHFQHHPENINRAGAPPKTHWWTQLYMDELEKDSIKQAGLKKKESVVKATVDKAEDGDMQAIKEIGDRVQGKSPQAIGTLGETGEFNEQKITGFVIEFVGEEKGSVPTEA